MQTDRKQRAREIAHWLRIGSLTLSTLGPLINSISTRMRERSQEKHPQKEASFWQERVANLKRRGQKPRQRNNNLLILPGFFVGLVAASLAAFYFIRKKLQQQAEDALIQLTQYEHLQASQEQPIRYLHTAMGTAPAATLDSSTEAEVVADEEAIPDQATLVGIVSTKLFYPIEDPFEEQDPARDVVYFISEEEAKSQGFMPAR